MYIFLLRKWRNNEKAYLARHKKEKLSNRVFLQKLIAYAGFFPYAITLGKLFVDVDHFFVEVC